MSKKSLKIGLLIGAVPAVAVAWFLVSPLFINETVDEALIISPSSAAVPTRTEVLAMPPREFEQTMKKVLAEGAEKPDQMVTEDMMEKAAPEVVKQGKFIDADSVHQGSGDALVYRLPDGSHLLRLENFKVTNGPDLMVYLTRYKNPVSTSEVNEGFLDLGKLKGNVGNQNYVIPAGTDLAEFNGAVIWCELFGVLFSPAELSVQ